MRKQQLFGPNQSPVIIEPESSPERRDLGGWLAANILEVEHLINTHGALLFRGFEIADAAGFRQCVEPFGSPDRSGYVGGNSPRTAVGAGVFTSTEYDASSEISVHNEMSYSSQWPRLVFFQCVTAAEAGGQTTLVDGRAMIDALPARIVEHIASNRIVYRRRFSPSIPLGRSWQETYLTDDLKVVEQEVRKTGGHVDARDDGTLTVSHTVDGLVTDPASGALVWFNQVEQWHPSALDPEFRDLLISIDGADSFPHDCCFEDGSSFSDDDLVAIRTAQQSLHLLFDWEPHDLLIVDNVKFMHGRQPFTGERRVLVSFA